MGFFSFARDRTTGYTNTWKEAETMKAVRPRERNRRGAAPAQAGKIRIALLVVIVAAALLLAAPLLLLMRRSRPTGPAVAESDTPFAKGIRLVGVRPDMSDDILDAEGKKIDELFAYSRHLGSTWSANQLRRDFLFELPADEPVVLLPHFAASVTGTERKLGGSVGHDRLVRDGKPLLVLTENIESSYHVTKLVWNKQVRVERVDITLRFFHGPVGEARLTAEGPFTPETVIQTKGRFPCTLTFQQDPRRSPRYTFLHLSSPLMIDSSTPVLVYDKAGRRHVAGRQGGSSGSRRGTQMDYGVDNL